MLVHESVGQPGGVGEQVFDGHRRIGFDGDVALLAAAIEYAEVGPGPDVLGDGVVKLKQPLLVEHHERRTRDRLGHRVEAQNRVPRHRAVAFDIRESRLVEEGFLAPSRDEAHRTRVTATLDVAVDMGRDAGKAVQ